jgi:hypothetical protein
VAGALKPPHFFELDSDLPFWLATEKVSLDGVHGVRAKPPNLYKDEYNMINIKCPRYITSGNVTLIKIKRPIILQDKL